MDPRVSQIICSFDYTSIKYDCWHRFAFCSFCCQGCTISCVPCFDWWEIRCPGLWCIDLIGPARAAILVVGPMWTNEEQSSSLQAASPLFFPRSLLQSTRSGSGWLHTTRGSPSATRNGLCCMRPRDRFPQPVFDLPFRILRILRANTNTFSHVYFPSLTSLFISLYLCPVRVLISKYTTQHHTTRAISNPVVSWQEARQSLQL